MAVPDIEKAVEHYTKVMGFPEAFRVRTPQGAVQLVYIQVSKDTFIELQSVSPERPAGIFTGRDAFQRFSQSYAIGRVDAARPQAGRQRGKTGVWVDGFSLCDSVTPALRTLSANGGQVMT